MLIVTAKVDKRKLFIAGIAVITAILLLLALTGRNSEPTAAMNAPRAPFGE